MSQTPAFSDCGFFVLRTPLSPLDEFTAWSSDLTAPQAQAKGVSLAESLQTDRTRLRERLRGLAARDHLREALFVASPNLQDRLEAWLADPHGDARKLESAVVRYFTRSVGRATPFGLFAGCSLGQVDKAATTNLSLDPRSNYRRHTRLDMEFLLGMADHWLHDPRLRRRLKLTTNTTIYRAAGQIRFAESHFDGTTRSHRLTAVEDSEPLSAVLRQAESGATAEQLAQSLVGDDISLEEAQAFIDELIDSQLLVAEATPPITGPEPIHALISQLDQAAPAAANELRQVRDALADLDRRGVGAPAEEYRRLASSLSAYPGAGDPSRLFQVDMIKPAQATLGGEVLEEISKAVRILHRLTAAPADDALDRFRKAFRERYGEREMPLAEVLDDEVGIGFERDEAAGEISPLIEGLAPRGEQATEIAWRARHALLLEKVLQASASGASEIQLSEDDLRRLSVSDPAPLPDAFAMMAVIAAPSPSALERGEFRLLACGADGPSGARGIGRFCHKDPALEAAVVRHLRAEESLRPDAVFAEIVHLPEGRIGNVLLRPVLRDYEIPYLGQSGADADRQLPLGDLYVSVVDETIRLRSARLGKEVIPRMSTAHNFAVNGPTVYRFLCRLQGQNMAPWLTWDWGPLESAPFVPRVAVGRLVLSRARWLLRGVELAPLAKARGDEIYLAVQRLRDQRRLPRYIVLADRDNELLVDLDNVLSVESFVELVKSRSEAMLLECFPGPDELAAHGPEGRYVHEILAPMVRVATGADQTPLPEPAADATPIQRQVAPGSECLYAKIYCGAAAADRLLAERLRPLVDEALADGVIDGWFFLRYADPENHLRLRFFGSPKKLAGELLPRLHAALAGALAEGSAWRLQIDTYEREVERYAGPLGMALSEELFQADSEAALGLAEQYAGQGGFEARWRLVLLGCHRLLVDLGLSLAQRASVVRRLRESFGREFGAESDLRPALGKKHRPLRKEIDELLAGDDRTIAEQHPQLCAGLALLHRRSLAIRPLADELSSRQAQGRLSCTVEELATSYLHMWVNRALRSAQRAHELVLYDFLDRAYQSALARRSPAPV